MPGARQPVNLLVAKGRKHLTKAEIAKRQAIEVTANSDKVKAPSYLSKELRKEFNKIAKELLAIGIITNLDVDALARYVIAQALYNKSVKSLLKAKPEDLLKMDVSQQDKLFKQCRSAAMDLGLTISSRCKLVLPTPKEPEKDNPYARFAKK